MSETQNNKGGGAVTPHFRIYMTFNYVLCADLLKNGNTSADEKKHHTAFFRFAPVIYYLIVVDLNLPVVVWMEFLR